MVYFWRGCGIKISLSERARKAYSENAGEAVTLDKAENVIETATVEEAATHPFLVIIPSPSHKEYCENCRDVKLLTIRAVLHLKRYKSWIKKSSQLFQVAW